MEPLGGRPATVVVCSILPGATEKLRKVLMAARKVADAEPTAAFFFKGAQLDLGEKMATSLDIADRCIFLPSDDSESFLSILGTADAVLLVPPGTSCYIHPQVYTLLQSGAPLVAVRDSAFDEVLTDQTSIQVLLSAESMAQGLLRALREPLFSQAIAAEGRQLAAHHTFSSFKHQVRMAYRQLSQKE
jgi:glycosyltransferase involved in cell wall biosynthesis